MRFSRRNMKWVGALAALTLITAACGDGSSDETDTTPDDTEPDDTEPDDTEPDDTEPDDDASGDPIVFGILTHQTGGLAALGVDHELGTKAAVDVATDGTMEIEGRPIEFVVYDDTSESGEAARVARQMIQQDSPDVVFGFPSSASAMASAQILIDAGTVDIYAIASTNALSAIAPTSFRTSRNATQEAQMGARVVDIQEGQTFALLAPDYEYGQSAAESWAELLTDQGGEQVGDIVYAPFVAEDYTAAVERVRGLEADVVVVVTWASTGGPLLWNQIGDAGIAEQSDVYTMLPQIPAREAMGPVARQIGYFAIYDPNLPNNEMNNAFLDAWTTYTDAEMDIYAGDSAVAAMLAVDAIRANGGSTDADSLIEVMRGFEGEGVKGPYIVRAEDHAFLQTFYAAELDDNLEAVLVEEFTVEDSEIPLIQEGWS